MVPYKKIPLIIEAFAAMPDKRLVVIGEGPEFARCKAAAAPNIELLGYQPFEVLRDHMQRARAFVFAAEEDFGIVPIEAQACGTPVIAFGKGGACETIAGISAHAQPEMGQALTSVFFAEQTAPAIRAAVERFESMREAFTPQACRENALRFAPERFRSEFEAFVEGSRARFKAGEPVDGWWLRESG